VLPEIKEGIKEVLTEWRCFYIICSDKKRAFHGKVQGEGE